MSKTNGDGQRSNDGLPVPSHPGYHLVVTEESRSLWEQFDSNVDPSRKGRVILICVAFFYVVTQLAVLGATILSGDLDRFFIFGVGAAVFWLLFYFMWIGVHW